MKHILLFLLFISLLNVSCSNIRKDTDKFTVNTVFNLELNDSVYHLMNDYINKYPQFNTFMLMIYPFNDLVQINRNDYSKVYMLGPLYEGILKKNENPIFYITIANKQIFIESGIESLMKTSMHQNAVFLQKVIPLGMDSLVLSNDWIIKDGSELYIYKAIFFSVHNERIFIHPDTIFVPQLKETIEFKNIE